MNRKRSLAMIGKCILIAAHAVLCLPVGLGIGIADDAMQLILAFPATLQPYFSMHSAFS